MEFQPGSSREGLGAVVEVTGVSVNIEVTTFVMLKVLFEFESLVAVWVRALEDSVGKLH